MQRILRLFVLFFKYWNTNKKLTRIRCYMSCERMSICHPDRFTYRYYIFTIYFYAPAHSQDFVNTHTHTPTTTINNARYHSSTILLLFTSNNYLHCQIPKQRQSGIKTTLSSKRSHSLHFHTAPTVQKACLWGCQLTTPKDYKYIYNLCCIWGVSSRIPKGWFWSLCTNRPPPDWRLSSALILLQILVYWSTKAARSLTTPSHQATFVKSVSSVKLVALNQSVPSNQSDL